MHQHQFLRDCQTPTPTPRNTGTVFLTAIPIGAQVAVARGTTVSASRRSFITLLCASPVRAKSDFYWVTAEPE